MRKIFLLFWALLATTCLWAHNFEVDGIYYNYLDGNNVEVTYKGSSYYSSAYSGEVTIPETVTYNGTTNSVTSIGERAFYYCSSLTSITIPNSVTSIGDYAFYWCSSLTSITIPNSVTSIGEDAFSWCSSLTSMVVETGNTIYDSRDNCNAIIETATNTLFIGCGNSTIPNSVTSIGEKAFYYCSSLTSITIPNSVTSIGEAAFYECTALTSVTIPNSVTSIGSWAFDGCSSLTSINIPNSITTIGEYVFFACSSLTSMVVEEGNTTYDSRDNCNAIIETATNTLIAGCQNTIIPNGVTSIGNYAFYGCSSLTLVTIPNSVTSIGDNAFAGCTFAKDKFINTSSLDAESNNYWGATIVDQDIDGLLIQNDTVIGYRGHKDTIVIPNTVVAVGNNAFQHCSSLTAVTIGSSVTNIGEGAFRSCSSLTSVTIGNSVTSIGERAFYGCSSLTSLTIPNSVTSIGKYAFYDCSSLTSITIPDSVTSIGEAAFSGCSSLTSVTIPNSVTSIGQAAFSRCSSLAKTNFTGDIIDWCKIEFGNASANPISCSHNLYINDIEVKDLIIPEGVTSIGESAFFRCTSLTSLNIPNSVTSIGDAAFFQCTSLTSITIGNSVTSIGDAAFKYCVFTKDNFINRSSLDAEANNYWGATMADQIVDGLIIRNDTVIDYIGHLDTIVIPDGVLAIADDVFRSNSKIKSVTIPNSVIYIGKLAFAWCSSLTSIVIPESVTTMGNNAFQDCDSLTSIVWNPVSCTGFWTGEAIYSIFYGCENVTSVTFGDKVAEIPRCLCEGMHKLTSITIPNSVTSIGDWAFNKCYSINSATISNNVTRIGNNAFRNCDSLTSITIPNGVETIGDYAFYDCVALQNAILGNRVTTIGQSAFYECSSLTSITIPNSVTSIGNNAFYDCYFTKENFINNSSLDEVANDYWGAEIADIEQDGLFIRNDTVVGCRPMVTSVIIPDTITCIGNYAFRDCSSVSSITIPNSVTSIGISAFSGCSSLNSITIPNSVINIGRFAFEGTGIYNDESNWENDVLYIDNCLIRARETITGTYNIKENTRMIGGGAFWFCTSLESIIIPESVTNIGEYAFVGCASITSIDLPNRITSIGRSTFNQCSSLASITIPNSVTSIGESAFRTCSSLTSITIPNSVTSIGNYVFNGCSSLTSITIPNSVTSIGNYAFNGCSSFTSITIPKSVISIGERAFINCISLTTLVVEPDNTIYDSRDNCNAIIETATNTLVAGCQNTIIPSDIKSLGYGAFQGCTSLTSITIPTRVTTIGNYAFYNCSSLDTIYVEATTPPTIESNTFTNTPAPICYIPCGTKSVYEASAWAQYMGEFVEHAVELTSGICGENLYWEYADTKLTISGTGAMYDNIVECLPWAWLLDSIRSIEISEGVTHIATYAFDGCSALRELHLPASVLAIGEYAFGNTPRLYEITCLAPEPPVADISSFTNYDAYLHAYCDAQRYYSIDPVWKNFHNVECIVTENEVTGDVTITPSDYEATVVWLSHADAAAYALVITKNDVTFCTLKFNKYGQLTNIAFAPSRTHHNKQQAAEATSTGYSFTITGLDENTTYGYAFSVLNEESAVIEEFVGEFTTQSNVSTAVDNVDTSFRSTQKLLRDGNLVIIRDGVEYNVMGQQL